MRVKCTTCEEIRNLDIWDREEGLSACPVCEIEVDDKVLNIVDEEDSIMKYAKDYEIGY